MPTSFSRISPVCGPGASPAVSPGPHHLFRSNFPTKKIRLASDEDHAEHDQRGDEIDRGMKERNPFNKKNAPSRTMAVYTARILIVLPLYTSVKIFCPHLMLNRVGIVNLQF